MRILHPTRTRSAGLTLVELMISLAIGSVIIIGVVFVYSQSRTTFAMNETFARLQENARFAMGVIESDVQLAGFFGFTNAAEDIRFTNGVGLDVARQAAAPRPEVPVSAHACGNNFAVDLLVPIQASNDGFQLGLNRVAPCVPFGAGEVLTSDTLTIRRSGTVPIAASATTLQLYTSRLGRSNHRLFNSAAAPGVITVNQADVRDLTVRTYYISRDSDDQAGFPSLRVLLLGNDGAQPQVQDFEVMPGVEDLQVQFGIDLNNFNGIATRYVNPNSPLLANAQVVAVRLWLRLRSEQPDRGFQDNRNYVYGTANYTPAGAERNFHRLLVSKTIQLRNARTL